MNGVGGKYFALFLGYQEQAVIPSAKPRRFRRYTSSTSATPGMVLIADEACGLIG
jgi:hypothetical protein